MGNNPLLHFLFSNILTVDLGYAQAGENAVQQLLDLLETQKISHSCVDYQLFL